MTDTTEAQDQQEDQQQEQQPNPAEAEARKLGWRPEEDWTGDTDNWLTRDQFMERNKRLADRGDKILKAEVGKLTRANQDLTKTVQDLGAHLTKADQRAYAKAAKDLQTRADQAAEEGDSEAYRRTRGEMKELETEARAEVQAKAKASVTTMAPQARPDDPEFDAWLPGNAWYDPGDDGFDAEMATYADSIAPSIGRLGLTGTPFYDRIATEVKKKFDKGSSARRRAPAVEGGGNSPRRSNGKAYADLPADAKAACDRLVGQKVWHDIEDDKSYVKNARERYCREFFEE